MDPGCRGPASTGYLHGRDSGECENLDDYEISNHGRGKGRSRQTDQAGGSVTADDRRTGRGSRDEQRRRRVFVQRNLAGTYAIVATGPGFKTATAIVSVSAKGAAPVVVSMEAEKAVSLAIAATRLNQMRNSLSPNTGGSKYTFTQQAIQELPQGANTPLNHVILQAPGVAQDSYGQLHVRGDHANLQYRINGIQLPEGITGFGQILSPRFAQSISLLTGALPAEYGLRTAGVIDIKTKDGSLDNLADVDFYGGQRGRCSRASSTEDRRATSATT